MESKSTPSRTDDKIKAPLPSQADPQPSDEVWSLSDDPLLPVDRVSFWAGISIGLLVILCAYMLNRAVDRLDAVIGNEVILSTFSTLFIDGYFTLFSLIGVLLSIFAAVFLSGMRRHGVPGYFVIALAGCAVSGAVLWMYTMDYVQWMSLLVESPTEAVWPEGLPTWSYPLSVSGISLSLVALSMSRAGSKWDRILGVSFSAASLVAVSVPALLGFGDAGVVTYIPTLLTLSGFFMVLSGLRLHSLLSSVNLDRLEGRSAIVLSAALLVTGILMSNKLPAGRELSAHSDWLWAVPLFAASVISLVSFVVHLISPRKTLGQKTGLFTSLAGLVVSAEMLFFLMLMNVNLYWFERTYWLAPVSVLGITLALYSCIASGSGTRIDKSVGSALATVPLLVLGVIALLVESEPASTTSIVQPALLTGGAALWTYALLAVAVYFSGFGVETRVRTFIIQWPILREKLHLLESRSRSIMMHVLKNPMGLIGIVILSFFIFLAVFGPTIAPYKIIPETNGPFEREQLPSADHWMGTDSKGNDIFSCLLYGARTSIIVGIFAAIISSILGALVGLYSGFVGGWKDEVLMRFNDVLLSVPWLVLMILIAGLVGTINLTGIILIIGLTGWSGTARLVRASVMSIRERQYVERARAIGADDSHIIRTHVMPNAFPLIFANTILTVALSILSEATLSFLRMRPYGTVTWGTMLSDAFNASAFHIGLQAWIIMPGICIVFLVLGFTLLGYALDEAMNPRLRKR